ncbi:MAG: DUF4975 domain-containing protein [Blautia sp.]|nr:DUF4975 domain-containing protein [Blautia sp.]
MFFLPAKDGFSQPFVGDCMPYYEDGVYYIYYLKEGGDSYHHAIYLTTTTDFLTYTEYEDPILEAGESTDQDDWVGTGSVVKTEDGYYLFYTGHTNADSHEYAETIMAARGTDLTSFEKITGWEITPDPSLNQKRDFRDPQGYYDKETGRITLTVTASQDGIARILKYSLNKDLTDIRYEGIIFTDPVGKVYNLECSDTFLIGDTWYLTYSAQDDVLWYAMSEDPYGPYAEPVCLDGPLFYAAKHVEDGENAYMVGWGRRSGSEKDTRKVSEWGGNLIVQQLQQLPDRSLVLAPVNAILNQYEDITSLTQEDASLLLDTEDGKVYETLCECEESFMLEGDFVYEGEGPFGLAFDYKDGEEDYKFITIHPEEQKLYLQFRGGRSVPAEEPVSLQAGQEYHFTYIQEDSVGVFYIEDKAAFTVRLYGVADKPLYLYSEGNTVRFSNLKQYR